jgi:hypothetical protein
LQKNDFNFVGIKEKSVVRESRQSFKPKLRHTSKNLPSFKIAIILVAINNITVSTQNETVALLVYFRYYKGLLGLTDLTRLALGSELWHVINIFFNVKTLTCDIEKSGIRFFRLLGALIIHRDLFLTRVSKRLLFGYLQTFSVCEVVEYFERINVMKQPNLHYIEDNEGNCLETGRFRAEHRVCCT